MRGPIGPNSPNRLKSGPGSDNLWNLTKTLIQSESVAAVFSDVYWN